MSKQIFLLALTDRGVQWQITDTLKEEDDFIFDPSQYYEVDEKQFFDDVRDLLQDNKDLRFDKGAIITDIIDLDIVDVDPLKIKKSSSIGKGKHIMEQHFDYEVIFDFLAFILANNIMNNKGYFITEDNMEQTYQDIIGLGVQEDIVAFESYFNSLNRLSPHIYHWNHYKKFKDKIDAAVDEAEAEALYQAYALLYT